MTGRHADRHDSPRRWLRLLGEAAGYLVPATLVAGAVFLNDPGLLVPDTKPELYLAPAGFLDTVASTWRRAPTLGDPNFNTGSIPAALAVNGLAGLGVDTVLLPRVVRFVLLMVGGAGAALLYHRLSPRPSGPGRVATASAYVASPFVIVQAASLPILQPFAFLPWMIIAFVGALRRKGGWSGPAAATIAFALMGGENAGVVPLFMLAALPASAVAIRILDRTSWGTIAAVSARTGLLMIGVSAYWLMPAIAARGSGAVIAAASERPVEVAAASSYAETSRLLGLWTLYGRTGDTPFLPGLVGYLTRAEVVVASFAIPIVAVLGAMAGPRTRVLPIMLLTVSLPLMVGLFGSPGPSPFGRGLAWLFENLPGAIAFRTTVKVGALAALAVAVLWGAAAEAAFRLPWRAAVPAALAGMAVLGLAAQPAWTGGLYRTAYRIPDYWLTAANEINAGPSSHRVLLVPGVFLAGYRWGLHSPDDVPASLFTRPAVLRVTVPSGGPVKSNFLAALDVGLNAGSLPPGALSTLARYAGASEVLARHDLEWERVEGAPPARIAESLAADPGLTLVAGYGATGEHTTGPASAPEDAELVPLQRWAVAEPVPIVRTGAAAAMVLVDGDNFAVPAAVEAGLLDDLPPYRLLGTLDAPRLAQALDDGARILLTDTNRRRGWNIHKLGASYTHTLTATEPTSGPRIDTTLTLFGDPERQTVSVLEGAHRIEASASGTVFGLTPRHKPFFAFDGDPSTYWLTGDLGTAAGQWITVTFPTRSVSEVRILPAPTRPVQVRRVAVKVGERTVEARLADEGSTVVEFPETVTDRLTIEILEATGAGLNGVGFSEIEIPGVTASEVIQMPRTLAGLAPVLDAGGRAALRAAPFDVLMVRSAEGAEITAHEEVVLRRRFEIPDRRTFSVTGRVAARSLDETSLDRLAGLPEGYEARSSSRAFANPALRASQAIDGRPDTAWRPAGDGLGEWIELRVPPRVLDRIRIAQTGGDGTPIDFISEVRITVNDDRPLVATLGPGETEVIIPRRLVGRVRIEVTGVAGFGGPVGIAEIDLGDPRPPAVPASQPLGGCSPILDVDGTPLVAELEGTVADLVAGRTLRFRGCEPLVLDGGAHRVEARPGWLVDRVHLASPGEGGPAPTTTGPRAVVVREGETRLTVSVDGSPEPFYLVLGRAFDPRWRAIRNGQDLGRPELLDGYSIAWRINDPSPSTIEVSYGPQRPFEIMLGISAATLLACLALLLRGRRDA